MCGSDLELDYRQASGTPRRVHRVIVTNRREDGKGVPGVASCEDSGAGGRNRPQRTVGSGARAPHAEAATAGHHVGT